MAKKASDFGIKGGKVGRNFSTGDKEANEVGVKSFGISDVGHNMVKSGKAAHPHWRSGAKGNKHAKRMYGHADTAHGHTKIKP